MYEKIKKNQKVQSETHLQGMRCFVRKGFVWGVECLFNCFPHSVPHRPTAASVSELKQHHWFKCAVPGEVQGTEGTGDVTWLSCGSLCLCCPAHSTIQFCYEEFQNHFLLLHWHLLLPVSNESFGTKLAKIGKGYASSDLGKQVATFRELKLSFSCD